MKFLQINLFLIFLFTQCFGMDFFFDKPKEYVINGILGKLKEKDAAQTLEPSEFWDMMAEDTSTAKRDTVLAAEFEEKSCFLSEFIADANEEDVCLVFRYLIKFGQEYKNKFYECITECTGQDGITPMNELIRYIKSKDSNIYRLFLQLLEVIKTLDTHRKIYILAQRELHKISEKCQIEGEYPILTAQKEFKSYIVDKIADIIFSDIDTEHQGSSIKSQDRDDCVIFQWEDRRTKSQP